VADGPERPRMLDLERDASCPPAMRSSESRTKWNTGVGPRTGTYGYRFPYDKRGHQHPRVIGMRWNHLYPFDLKSCTLRNQSPEDRENPSTLTWPASTFTARSPHLLRFHRVQRRGEGRLPGCHLQACRCVGRVSGEHPSQWVHAPGRLSRPACLSRLD
jgi:hypothetical protein